MEQVSPKNDLKMLDGHDYVLARNHLAACRLNLQYYLWRETLGFSIHPSIPKLPQSAVIADVATGTGLWMLDVLREYEDLQVDGLYIHLSQAPHPERLPPNITLRQWDIFTDMSSDLIGRYDFVHVRLLVLVSQHQPPNRQFVISSNCSSRPDISNGTNSTALECTSTKYLLHTPSLHSISCATCASLTDGAIGPSRLLKEWIKRALVTFHSIATVINRILHVLSRISI